MPDLFRPPTAPTVVDPDAEWLDRITNAPAADDIAPTERTCQRCGQPFTHPTKTICNTCHNRHVANKRRRRQAQAVRAQEALERLTAYANTLDPGPYRDGVTDTLAALCDALED